MQKRGDLHQLGQLVLLAQSCGGVCSRGMCLLPGHLVVWVLALRIRGHDDLLSIYSVLGSITYMPPSGTQTLESRCSSLMDKEMEIHEGKWTKVI